MEGDKERRLVGHGENSLLDARALDVVVLNDHVLLEYLDRVQLVRALPLRQRHLAPPPPIHRPSYRERERERERKLSAIDRSTDRVKTTFHGGSFLVALSYSILADTPDILARMLRGCRARVGEFLVPNSERLPDWSVGSLLLCNYTVRLSVCRVVLQIPRARRARLTTCCEQVASILVRHVRFPRDRLATFS